MILPIIIMVMDSLCVGAIDSADSVAFTQQMVQIRMGQTIARTKIDSLIDKLQSDAEAREKFIKRKKK